MTARLEFNAEPLPGYRLIERLGGGGFGEVWKCEAPGGLHKAIKFVYGDLQSTDDGERAEQELKALARVKTVRHPYILSLERYDIINGQLLIVMELADRNLWDRFKECRAQGLPGIPRDELLGYLAETAEALDLMNGLYQLQHLDIKPQNLFLVHNHVKVADFGLVKDLEGLETKVTGGITPVYAAPETFDGIVSRHSDQYSLAICYQELLTGQRPFSGSNIRQLILQHLQGQPNVATLPSWEQPIILRALAKTPADRFPTCMEMVQLLKEGEPSASLRSEVPTTGTLAESRPEPAAIVPSDSTRIAGANRPSSPPDSGPGTTHPLRSVEAQATAAHRSAPLTGSAGNQPRKPVPEIKGDGCLFPGLVIGLGQSGLGILRRLRERLVESFGGLDALPSLKLLLLDTDPDVTRTATQGKSGPALSSNEVLLAPLNRPSHYLKPREGRPSLETWIPQQMLYRIPRSQVTTGVRALGRLAFCDNYRLILHRLAAELDAILDPAALQRAASETGCGLRTNRPRVYLIANLAGGTGSGMFLDLAYVLRSLIRQRGFEQPDIVAVLLVPDSRRGRPGPENWDERLRRSNTFAALTELRYFATPGTVFTGRYHERETPLSDGEPPFVRTILLPLPDESEEVRTRELQDMTGQMLFRDLGTPLGRVADLGRAGLPGPPWNERGLYAQTFGLHRLSWPRRELLREAARHLCMQLVVRWMSKDSKPILGAVTSVVKEQWQRRDLGVESFLERLQDRLREQVGKDPETALLAVVEPLVRQLRAASSVPAKRWGQVTAADIPPDELQPVVEELERLLGKPSEETLHVQSSLFDTYLRTVAESLMNEWSQKLTEIAVRLLEEPEFRLAGAEEAIRQLLAQLEQILQHHEPLGKDFDLQAKNGYNTLQEILAGRGKQLNYTPDQLITILRAYPKVRLQSLILHRISQTFLALRGHLSDELREVNFCRVRLGELLRSLEALGTPVISSSHPGRVAANFSAQGTGLRPEAGRILLPGGCKSLSEALEKIVAEIGPDQLLELDHQIEAMIREKYQALVNVCLSNTPLRGVQDSLLEVASRFANGHLAETSVADLFLQQTTSNSLRLGEVEVCLQKAEPDLQATPRRPANQSSGVVAVQELVVLERPNSSAGEALQQLAEEALEGQEILSHPGGEDVIFYHERVHLLLTQLEYLSSASKDAYRQMTATDQFTPHSRTDIDFASILSEP